MLTRWRPGRPGKTGAAEAKELARELEDRIDTLARARLTSMAATYHALEPGWQHQLENDATFVLETANIRHAIRCARDYGRPRQQPSLRFQVSSLFLRDCHAYLASDPEGRERMHLVSGSICDDVHVMSRMINVQTDQASAAYVRADTSTHKTIVELVERDGHDLFAMFHSHIMHGAESTRPSGVDIANQERFVSVGWTDVLGGIFSLDGYIRLYSTCRDFNVALYGNGADIITATLRQTIIKLHARS